VTFFGNSGLCYIVCAQSRNTVGPVKGISDLQTVICVLAARLRWCPTLSNPVPWRSWMVAYLRYTLVKTPFPGWPIMVH